MTRSIGTFERLKHDDVMRATHGVSVISHSLHDCIGGQTVCGLRTPPLTCCGRRWCRHRCVVAATAVAAASQPTSTSWGRCRRRRRRRRYHHRRRRCCRRHRHRRRRRHRHRRSKRGPVLYAPAHTLYLACVLNADRCLWTSFCLHSVARAASSSSLLLPLLALVTSPLSVSSLFRFLLFISIDTVNFLFHVKYYDFR